MHKELVTGLLIINCHLFIDAPKNLQNSEHFPHWGQPFSCIYLCARPAFSYTPFLAPAPTLPHQLPLAHPFPLVLPLLLPLILHLPLPLGHTPDSSPPGGIAANQAMSRSQGDVVHQQVHINVHQQVHTNVHQQVHTNVHQQVHINAQYDPFSVEHS